MGLRCEWIATRFACYPTALSFLYYTTLSVLLQEKPYFSLKAEKTLASAEAKVHPA